MSNGKQARRYPTSSSVLSAKHLLRLCYRLEKMAKEKDPDKCNYLCEIWLECQLLNTGSDAQHQTFITYNKTTIVSIKKKRRSLVLYHFDP